MQIERTDGIESVDEATAAASALTPDSLPELITEVLAGEQPEGIESVTEKTVLLALAEEVGRLHEATGLGLEEAKTEVIAAAQELLEDATVLQFVPVIAARHASERVEGRQADETSAETGDSASQNG